MQKFIILFSLAFLASCTGVRYAQQPPSTISVNRNVKLNTKMIWPMEIKGSYLQKVTVSVMGKQQTFSVHLTMDEWMLETVAFNDFAGRLYHLKCTPDYVDWEGSAFVPSIIKPDNILVDFLLVHLPEDQLKRLIQGASVFEKGDSTAKTRLIKNRNVLRVIHYQHPIGQMWGHVVRGFSESVSGRP
jgi:hypothetical protein